MEGGIFCKGVNVRWVMSWRLATTATFSTNVLELFEMARLGSRCPLENNDKEPGVVRWWLSKMATGTGGTGYFGELRKCKPLAMLPCNHMSSTCGRDTLWSRAGVQVFLGWDLTGYSFFFLIEKSNCCRAG